MKFEDFYNKEVKKKKTLSIEMIDFQSRNDPFVVNVIQHFTSLKEAIEKENIQDFNKSSIYDNWKTLECIENIDKEIEKKFGFKAKHIDSKEEDNYACMPSPPLKPNVLSPYFLYTYEIIRSYLKMNTWITKKDTKDVTNVSESLHNFVNNVNKMNKQLATEGIKIDLKKGYISGLPSDYAVFFHADFYSFFFKFNITPEELTAILLHEIGHCFTHIENSYRTVRECSVIAETINENTGRKGKSTKETLLLVANEIMEKDKVEDLKSFKADVIALSVIKQVLDIARHDHALIDSEQLADQFSGRFGLSKELVSGLNKINSSLEIQFSRFWGTVSLISIVFLILFIFMASGTFLLLVLISGAISGFLSLLDLIFFSGTDEERGYDNPKQRLVRIRNEIVRRLRNMNMSKEDSKAVLSSLDAIEEIIENTPKPSESTWTSIKRFFSSKYRELEEMKKIEQELENVMENDLHIASARIKSLI